MTTGLAGSALCKASKAATAVSIAESSPAEALAKDCQALWNASSDAGQALPGTTSADNATAAIAPHTIAAKGEAGLIQGLRSIVPAGYRSAEASTAAKRPATGRRRETTLRTRERRASGLGRRCSGSCGIRMDGRSCADSRSCWPTEAEPRLSSIKRTRERRGESCRRRRASVAFDVLVGVVAREAAVVDGGRSLWKGTRVDRAQRPPDRIVAVRDDDGGTLCCAPADLVRLRALGKEVPAAAAAGSDAGLCAERQDRQLVRAGRARQRVRQAEPIGEVTDAIQVG